MRGAPIQEANFLNPRDIVKPDITYSQGFAQMEACHGAHLDQWGWECGTYPAWFKARVLAWWRQHQLIGLHVRDAGIKKGKKA